MVKKIGCINIRSYSFLSKFGLFSKWVLISETLQLRVPPPSSLSHLTLQLWCVLKSLCLELLCCFKHFEERQLQCKILTFVKPSFHPPAILHSLPTTESHVLSYFYFRTFSDAFTVFSLLLYMRFVFGKVLHDPIQSLFIAQGPAVMTRIR